MILPSWLFWCLEWFFRSAELSDNAKLTRHGPLVSSSRVALSIQTVILTTCFDQPSRYKLAIIVMFLWGMQLPAGSRSATLGQPFQPKNDWQAKVFKSDHLYSSNSVCGTGTYAYDREVQLGRCFALFRSPCRGESVRLMQMANNHEDEWDNTVSA